MKRHELHALLMGIFGFVILLGYQNCGKPTLQAKNTPEIDNPVVGAFNKIKCMAQSDSIYNSDSVPDFNEDTFNDYDIFYNDVDCDSKVDALLVHNGDPEIMLTCFNYQDYGFGNCYPQTEKSSSICGLKNKDCNIVLKSTNIPAVFFDESQF